MSDVPPTPRPRKPSAKPRAEAPRERVTNDTTDTPPPPPKPPRPGRTPNLQKRLEEFLSAPALICSMAGDEYPAQIIATRAPAMAEAWYELSKENAAVRRILTRMTEGGAWGGVVISSMATILPVAGYYGLLPAVDPFSSIYPEIHLSDTPSSPIVPPPPTAAPSPPRGAGGGGGTPPPSGMTPPLSPDQPPGVVTVAGTNNNAR